MTTQRALATAPVAIFPVALAFVMARSLLAGDLRELFAAPFSALLIAAIGYPLALFAGWVMLRLAPAMAGASLARTLTAGVASAELIFWLLVHPFWQREFSNLFCAALVAACGLATAAAFRWLEHKHAAD
jgi:hypothetical protein